MTNNGSQPVKLLRNFWYVAMPARELKPGKLIAKTLLNEPVMFGRAKDGAPFALRNVCPHRGMPLSNGWIDEEGVSCCYHGWKFGPDGGCVNIPSLLPEEKASCSRIRVNNYPCREVQGIIWVFIGDEHEPAVLPEVPRAEGFGNVAPQVHCVVPYALDADNAIYTLMDPSHVAYVHTSWFVKRDKNNLRERKKTFEPMPLGWRMKRHKVPAEHRAYRLFGKDVTTEICYVLPGTRIESISGDRHCAVTFMAATPLTDQETAIHMYFYWTHKWLNPFWWVVHFFTRHFLNQDRRAAIKHREGLRYDPTLIFFGGGDAQAAWFHRLRVAWFRSEAANQPFENPLREETLRWRS